MAKYIDYINQAKSNLSFLNQIHSTSNGHIDWQVTVCFYVGVHLVNAYLVKERGMSFNSHTETFDAINFVNVVSPVRFTEEDYLAYRKLYNLSRRSRYICTDADKLKGQDDSVAYLTYDKHLGRSVKSLDKLLQLINNKYKEEFDKIEVNILDLKKTELSFFSHKKAS